MSEIVPISAFQNWADQAVVVALGLLAWGFATGPSALCAQNLGASQPVLEREGFSSRYVTKTWTTEDGLPNNSVYALEQADSGMLWVGTLGGLARFDGHSFTTFNAASLEGLAGNRIHVLHQGASGTLWIGTWNGVSTYRGGHFEKIDTLAISRISERPGGTVWFGGSDGLYRTTAGGIPAGGLTAVPLPDSLSGAFVTDVEAIGPDSVWVVAKGHLLLYRNGAFEHPYSIVQTEGWKEQGVRRVERGPDGTLWVQGDQVMSIREGTRTLYDLPGSSKHWGSFRTGPSGAAWLTMGKESGLLRFSDSTRREVTEASAVPTQHFVGLSRDESGQWWVGTYREGLVRLRPRLFRQVDREPVEGRAIHGLSLDRRGALWAGVFGTGVVRLAGPTLTVWTPDDGVPPQGEVWTTGHDATGIAWILTDGGLVQRRDGGFEPVRSRSGKTFDGGRVLYRDSTGTLWIGDVNRGLYRYREGTLTRALSADRLSARVLALHRAQDGALWIGTQSRGVARLEGNGKDSTLTWYGTADGVPYASVRDVHETADGTIWIGTYGGGIARFEGDHFTPVTPEDGLPAGTIHVIHEAPDGVFWMTSNEGVFRVSRSQVEAVADGRRDRLYARVFGTDDGLPSRECNGNFHPALAEDGSGRLWIPTMRGLAVVDPASDRLAVPDSVPVRVTGLRADGTALPLDSLRLGPSTYRVALDFTAISLRHADDLSFRYRLDGTPWTPARGRRTAEFTGLEAGPHRFEVQATIDGETWYALETPLRLTVAPYFYQTWWFRLLVGLGLVGLAAAGWRWRTYRLRRRKEELETAVKARTEELAEEKRKTERQAERLQELDEAKSRFFAHISHEFRTPLSLILSPLRGALSKATDGATGGSASLTAGELRRMTQNAERLQRLIDQLLDLATLEAGEMELELQAGDLAGFARRAAEAFRSRAKEKNIHFEVETPPGRIEMRFDPEKVETIVSNLVGNALKFTPEGGAVSVRLSVRKDAGKVDSPKGEGPASGTAQIEVEDTGPGIEPGQQDRIFERFGQAGRPGEEEGVGLGLTLTYELAKLHGGTVEVQSTPGEGTSFTVLLPMVPVSSGEGAFPDKPLGPAEGRPLPAGDGKRGGQEDADKAPSLEKSPSKKSPSEESPSEEPPSAEPPATLLIVEDNADMREYLREHLSERWRVLEASDGAEGWEVAEEEEPDLVLSDVMMPGLSGVELCERIKSEERLRAAPVLLLTARAGTDNAIEGLEAGADDYVTKPFDLEALCRRIENHLAARKHIRADAREEVRLRSIGETVEEEQMPFLREVTEAVEAHLSNPDFTAEWLADEVALSRRQLSRRLKETVGVAPGAFIRQVRVERAKELLEEGPKTVAEVAYAVGFRSPSHFSQRFQEEVGQVPTDYRTARQDPA